MIPNEKTIIREVPVTRFAIAKRMRDKAASQALSLASTDRRASPVLTARIPTEGRALLAHLLTCFIHEKSVTIEKAYQAGVWLDWLEGLEKIAAEEEALRDEELSTF